MFAAVPRVQKFSSIVTGNTQQRTEETQSVIITAAVLSKITETTQVCWYKELTRVEQSFWRSQYDGQQVKKHLVFYVTRSFITVFTIASHLSVRA
jgi:hypothetical protein